MSRKQKEFIIPVIVLILSLVTIVNSIINEWYPPIFFSSIGVVFFVFQLFGKKANWMLYLWAIPQIPYLISTHHGTISGLDFSQGFRLGLHYSYGNSQNGSTQIGINFLPLIILNFYYFFIYRVIKGDQISLTALKQNSLFDSFVGVINEKVHVDGEKGWYIIALDKKIEFEGRYYSFLIVKVKDENNFTRRKGKKIVMSCLLPDEELNKPNISKLSLISLGWCNYQIK